MDIFCDSHDITSRFEPYVIDLRRLFVFHGIACGGAEGLVALGVKLEESKAFRLDLPALLRNIHDLAGDRVTADEMLTVLALASGGADLVDGRVETVGLTRIVTLLRVLVAGAGAWSEEADRGLSGRSAEAQERVSAVELPRAAIELSLEQLRRQLSEIDRRIDRLEPVGAAVAPEMVTGEPEVREVSPDAGGVVELQEFAPAGGNDNGAAGAAVAPGLPQAEDGRRVAGYNLPEAGLREAEDGLRGADDGLPGVKAAYVSAVAAGVAGGSAAARRVAARVRSSRWSMGAVAAAVSLLVSLGVMRVASSMHARTILAKTAIPSGMPSARVGDVPAWTRAAGEPTLKVQPSGSGAESRTSLPAHDEGTEAPVPKPATPSRAAQVKAPAEHAAAGATIVPVNSAVMERQLMTSRKPVFPAAALAQGKNGTVVLNTFIAKNGSVSRMDVLSGAPPFVASAMAAVSWRQYRPYLLRGRPVEVVTPVTVTYHAP